MRNAGTLLMIFGGLVALFSFMIDTTVSSPGSTIAGIYVGSTSTHNLGLLQQQMMVFQSGLAAFLAGAFLLGAGTIVESSGSLVARSGQKSSEDEVAAGDTHEDKAASVARLMIGLGIAVVVAILLYLLAKGS